MITRYQGNIFGAVEVGHVFVISGKTIDDANVLGINLKNSKSDEANIIFHMSVRFSEDMIVRNSLEDGVWGIEEREDNLNEFTVPNPIVSGEKFKVYILVGDQRFHVSINGESYCTYYFRQALDDIKSIEVCDDLQSITQCDHRSVFPSPYPFIQVDDVRLEFSNDIPRKFAPGHIIVITAIPFGNARGMFFINFLEGITKKQALHFNARFDPQYVVVRNSMNDDLNYGREERDGGFPFFIDEQFKLAIAFTETQFKFAVNGDIFATFDYRTANQFDKLNGLRVAAANGLHMEITSVDHINNGPSDGEGFETYSHPDVHIF